MRGIVIILGLAAVAALFVSRLWPLTEYTYVNGNSHYSQEEVLWLANLAPGDPLLWVNRWSLAGLLEDPWIMRARVVRHWPDTVAVTVTEREPRVFSEGTAWSADGVALPGLDEEAAALLPLVEGWGEPRIEEAVRLLDLLGSEEPEVISYTPDGFDIMVGGAIIFTPSVAALEAQWAAVKGRLGNRLAVYPWGVSEHNE